MTIADNLSTYAIEKKDMKNCQARTGFEPNDLPIPVQPSHQLNY